MAAQTAKQVIIQRLREAERNVIYQNYKDREGSIVQAVVQKREGRNVVLDLDTNVTAFLPMQEQIRFERYNVGDRIKVLLLSVALTTRGPELIVSRAHPDFVRKLFATEIPEIANGTIDIKGVAREAGSRSKVSVFTEDNSIDPIGSCIGQRGARIQTIINEIGGEKVDIIEYSEDPKRYISNSLLPAKVTSVTLHEEERAAVVTVPADQLSLTIGREGQNVRLAVKLTGWKINIKEAETGKEIMGEGGAVIAPVVATSLASDVVAAVTEEATTPVEAAPVDAVAADAEATEKPAAKKPRKKKAKKTAE
jgi:N utilization substance protein A